MTTKPKTRKVKGANAALDSIEARGERLDDLNLCDAMNEMTCRCFGLMAVINGASFSDNETRNGVLWFASDVADGMKRLAKAFNAESKRRDHRRK